ncbi:MAG: LLM class flavin-dependent oxidoreductase [Gammaproteobacteria bacterium]|nr:LLM class flavin-dependent oxidoreductase [Gammaproteobacteria bacterium]
MVGSANGRLLLGTGWNDVEYEAIGENFHDHGVRSEEQIEVMRRLWAQDTIEYQGRWPQPVAAGAFHTRLAGLNGAAGA